MDTNAPMPSAGGKLPNIIDTLNMRSGLELLIPPPPLVIALIKRQIELDAESAREEQRNSENN